MARRAAAPWRLLVHGPAAGPLNMAVDEAILDRYARSAVETAPTLRLYGWHPPALSLGRKQPSRGSHDPRFLAAEGIDLVRRPTGGRAVLHEHERTYSVVGLLRRDPFPGGVTDTYRRIAAALVAGLGRLGLDARALEPGGEARRDPGPGGPPVCFEVAASYEISVRGLKLAGSAQLRRRGAFLQHGSLLIRADPRRLARAIGTSPAGRTFTDLKSELGRPPDPEALDAALVAGFEEVFGTALVPGLLEPEEAGRAETLCREKYRSDLWTLEGVEPREAGSGG